MRKQIIIILTALVFALAGCGDSAQPKATETTGATATTSATGETSYELYSWEAQDKWVYALFEASNRPKTYEEIISGQSAVIGIKALESRIQQLPKRTEIVWRKEAPPDVTMTSTEKSYKLAMPSQSRVQKLKDMCDKSGIKLNLL